MEIPYGSLTGHVEQQHGALASFDLGLDLSGGAMVTYRPELEAAPRQRTPQERLALTEEALAGRPMQRFDPYRLLPLTANAAQK